MANLPGGHGREYSHRQRSTPAPLIDPPPDCRPVRVSRESFPFECFLLEAKWRGLSFSRVQHSPQPSLDHLAQGQPVSGGVLLHLVQQGGGDVHGRLHNSIVADGPVGTEIRMPRAYIKMLGLSGDNFLILLELLPKIIEHDSKIVYLLFQ